MSNHVALELAKAVLSGKLGIKASNTVETVLGVAHDEALLSSAVGNCLRAVRAFGPVVERCSSTDNCNLATISVDCHQFAHDRLIK